MGRLTILEFFDDEDRGPFVGVLESVQSVWSTPEEEQGVRTGGLHIEVSGLADGRKSDMSFWFSEDETKEAAEALERLTALAVNGVSEDAVIRICASRVSGNGPYALLAKAVEAGVVAAAYARESAEADGVLSPRSRKRPG